MKKTRIGWVDVLRGIAIIYVYLGHFAEAAGRFYPFVFLFHVPLFFFISGFFNNFSETDTSLLFKLKRNFFKFMIPYAFFMFLMLAMTFLETGGADSSEIYRWITTTFTGVRGKVINGTAWFFPCLFCVSCLFELIKHILKKPIIIANFCIILFLVEEYCFAVPLRNHPTVFWNIDSALYYLFFYMLGSISFPAVNKLFDLLQKRNKKALFLSIPAFAGLGIFTVFIFYRGMSSTLFLLPNRAIPLVEVFFILLLISFNIGISFILSHCSVLKICGRSTLYLCGNEQVSKQLLFDVFAILNINIAAKTPMQCCIYIAVLVFINIKYIMPVEKKILERYTEVKIYDKDTK